MTDKIAWDDIHDPNDSDWRGFIVNKDWVQDDPISGVQFIAPEDSAITITSQTVEAETSTGTPVKALFSGGEVGTWPILTRVSTVAGRQRDKTIYLNVREN